MDLISDYFNAIYEITDTPKIYVTATAYHLISSTLGKYFVCPFLPMVGDNIPRPNLWVIISGPPNITRKSTVIGNEYYVLSEAYKNYYRLSNPRLLDEDIEKIVREMIIETGSPEGIVDHICEMQETLDTFVLMSSEWGAVLRKMRGATYMEDLSNLLSKLYDGESYIWYGSRRRKEGRSRRFIRKGLYVTAIVGLQRINLYVDRFYLEQGLLRRFLIVYSRGTNRDRWYPPLDLSRDLKKERLVEIAQRIGALMHEYSSIAPIIVSFTGEVRDKINEFARKMEMEVVVNEESNWFLYSQSLWSHLAKLVILHAIATKRPVPTGGMGYTITADMNDFQHAYNYLAEIIPNAQEAVSSIGVKVREVPIENYKSMFERVNAAIIAAGPEGITTRELLMRTGMSKSDLKTTIINLMEQDMVEVYRYVPRRGRPSIIIVSKNYANRYSDKILKSEKLDVNEFSMVW